ncbi:N-acyl homoserine lactonase family protein [Marinicella sp. W31]|uniref:N-acyl homoserine lactonase family protein n=1 Tax=Marinicella sp. W31 TaxID=3023713 RepID=UPI003756A474
MRAKYFRIFIISWVFIQCMVTTLHASDLRLWRLDCGEMMIDDISYFSDTYRYDNQSAEISNGCYLIQNGDRYLLWDAGIPKKYLNNTIKKGGWLSRISITIADQLAQIKLKPEDIDYLGISHFHGDHIGQALEFPGAKLLLNQADALSIKNEASGSARRKLSAWFDGDSEMAVFARDHDVFGDGRVTIIATPGHTPGHSSLLVKLKETGPVFLTGDLFHFQSETKLRNVSKWNTSRADTLASIERFEDIVKTLSPIVIVQHDKDDIRKLPAFPEAAE